MSYNSFGVEGLFSNGQMNGFGGHDAGYDTSVNGSGPAAEQPAPAPMSEEEIQQMIEDGDARLWGIGWMAKKSIENS